MRITVRRFAAEDEPAIDRLNERLRAGGSNHRLYREDLSRNPTADLAIRPVNDSLWVAASGGEIHGSAWLREQYFLVDGEQHRVGWMKYPVSESLVDAKYAGVPASMVFQLLRQQPCLMGIGMGGHDAPFARLLARAGWVASTIPLFFRVSRPFRFLRGMVYARRRKWWMRLGMDLAAWSGLGWLAHAVAVRTARVDAPADLTATVEPRFAPWADDAWQRIAGAYGALAVRDAKTLDFTFPASFPGLLRIRVRSGDTELGWVCAQILSNRGEHARYFGSLKVGLITDALALPSDAAVVLKAGVDHLEREPVDVVLVYLSHVAWQTAARRLRFLSGPSTLAFYRSPRAEDLLVGDAVESQRCHFTASDGHGPKRA